MDEHGKTGIFDAEHPPSRELIGDCVHCGFCLPACPTYALWSEEMDSPRGRVYLMKLGLDGEARMTDTYVEHFDRCLGCMACVTACPSGVQYGKLVEATRAQIERNHERTLPDRLFRNLIFALFPHPRRLRALAWPLLLYQASGLRWLLERSGVKRLLPARLAAMETLLPKLSLGALGERVPERTPAAGERRRRVGMLLGCVQRVFFNRVNAATARVLAAEGCEVIAPRAQGCCGALFLHAGREDEAALCARRMIDVFEREGVDQVVINAAGCGSTLKEYGHLLRDDPEYAGRAQAFSRKCVDFSEFLAGMDARAPRHSVPMRVAWHDACHLQHAQGITVAPRDLLAAIPDLDVLEIPEAGLCCGSAGIYNLVEPEPARELGDRKAASVLETGAEAVVSSNPGCLIQIGVSLERAGRALPMLHIAELVDASIRGGKIGSR